MAASMVARSVTRLRLQTNAFLVLKTRRHVAQVTGNEKIDSTLDTVTGGKIGGWLQKYEDIVGLTEVRSAQDKVITVTNILGKNDNNNYCDE